MAILAGVLILMCAGLMVGHGYHMLRHKETPKAEHHIMEPREHDHGQAAEPSSAGQQEDHKTIDEP